MHHAMHYVNHVLHGTHGLECFRLQATAEQRFQLDDQVNGIDAVDVQILTQLGIERDFFWLDCKGVLHDADDM